MHMHGSGPAACLQQSACVCWAPAAAVTHSPMGRATLVSSCTGWLMGRSAASLLMPGTVADSKHQVLCVSLKARTVRGL